MHYNHPFRKVFDLDSFNERASPRGKLFSQLYGLLDMNNQSAFPHVSSIAMVSLVLIKLIKLIIKLIIPCDVCILDEMCQYSCSVMLAFLSLSGSSGIIIVRCETYWSGTVIELHLAPRQCGAETSLPANDALIPVNPLALIIAFNYYGFRVLYTSI